MPVVPNGVACVAAALEHAGHDVRVLDLCFARDPHRVARESAKAFAPDVIGLSVRNIDNSDLVALAHYTPAAAALLDTLRASAPQAQVIAGGAAFGVAPEALSDELGVEHAVAGDGERATPALIAELAAGRAPGAIPGVVRRVDGRRVLTPPGGDGALDSLPPVHMHRWLDLKRYERRGGTVPIQTKRGCVFKCIYCTYLNVEGWGYRLREPELVADEIAELATDARIRHFEFVDSTFNAPPRHAMAVCEAIARRNLRVHLDTTNFTPATAQPELLSAMRHAGFKWLGITAESASDPVLEKLQKGFDVAQLRKVAENVERAGMGVLWIFLIGGPGETPATLEETLKFAAWRLDQGRRGLSHRGTARVSRYDAAHHRDGRGRGPARRPAARAEVLFLRAAADGGDARAASRLRGAPSALHVLRGLSLTACCRISRASLPRSDCRARTGATWACSSGSAARSREHGGR